jgi:polysaccharide biosynthesis transport protein
LQAPDLFSLVLEALQETYDCVLIEIEPSADADMMNAALAHAHGALVLAGHQGNGHAVEVGYRLEQAFDGQVGLLIVDAAPRDPLAAPETAYASV